MTFSRQLIQRLLLLLLLLALGLFAVVVSQRSLLENSALADRDIFVPEIRVQRLTAISQALAAPIQSGALAADVSFDQACGGRPAALLTQRVALGLGLPSLADAHQRLGAAFVAAQALVPQACRGFLSEVDLVLRHPALLREGAPQALHALVSQTLTERVSWNSVPPCLYLRDQGQLFYLRGPQGYCLDPSPSRPSGFQAPRIVEQPTRLNTPPAEIRLGTELALGASTRQLVQRAYAQLLDPQAVVGLPSEARRLGLTLHPGLSRVLDGFDDCWSQPGGCLRLRMPALDRTAGATVVLLNAETGAILAMRCYGPVCSSPAVRQAEPLAAALLEAPPASVAKLFFSLALAESGAAPRDLLLQIKTSGQLDPTVVKRNEWWERAALCDLQNRVAGAVPHSCLLPARAMAMSERFFWNTQCATDPSACGRVALSPFSQGMPGFMGVLRPIVNNTDATQTAPTAAKGKARPADLTYLNWNDYNRIRATGGQTTIGAPYRHASAAVQAVLGAAESRSSALGLAGVSSGIYLASQGRSPRIPSLLVDLQSVEARPLSASSASSSGEARSGRLGSEERALAAAARLVRQGMTKVMTPAESGWSGEGTASPAFRLSFGRTCTADCPIEAKTGTVSARDPRYAGTTTFTGLIDLPRLRQLIGPKAAGLSDLPPTIAMGLIVFSANPADAPRGHGASQLAMHVVREILAPDGLDPDTRQSP
ncbi:MAG: hypothetical protein RLZZ344_1120 [Pseudomonadota bacterium]|jgi:hypothetical protein